MKLLDCEVRLAGELHHVVPKVGVTESEIIVLRSIHGNDSVVGIKTTGEVQRSKSNELNRLAAIYGKQRVEELFRVTLDINTSIEDTVAPEAVQIPSAEQLMNDKGDEAKTKKAA